MASIMVQVHRMRPSTYTAVNILSQVKIVKAWDKEKKEAQGLTALLDSRTLRNRMIICLASNRQKVD